MNITLGFPLRVTAWIVAAALMSGCGGGGSAPSAALPGTPSNAFGAAAGASKSVKVRFHIAKSGANAGAQAASRTGAGVAGQLRGVQSAQTASAQRKPKYVSPYSAGVAIFATDISTGGKLLPPTFADISSTSAANAGGLSPLCTSTNGIDLTAGYDCVVQAPAVPGDSIAYTAVTLNTPPDNECTVGEPTCQLAYGTGFSSGYEISIVKSAAQTISTTTTTSISMTLNPLIHGFTFSNVAGYGTLVTPADGSTHPVAAQVQPTDASGNVITQLLGEVFVDPAGTPTPLTAASQNSSLVSGSSVSISAPATSPGIVTANFVYSGEPNGSADYGADPISIMFDNMLNYTTGVPIVGYCSPYDPSYNSVESQCSNYNGGLNGQGYYEYTKTLYVAPFVVTANSAALNPGLTSIPVTVALYGASSGFSTNIGSAATTSTCTNAQVTVTPYTISTGSPYGSTYVYSQAFSINNAGLASNATCTFNFTDSPESGSDLSPLITVTNNTTGSGFQIHVP